MGTSLIPRLPLSEQDPRQIARQLDLLSAKVATAAAELQCAEQQAAPEVMVKAVDHLKDIYYTLQDAFRANERWSRG